LASVRQSGLDDAKHDWATSEDVAFFDQQMPSSPVLPAVSPKEGTFIGGDYFCLEWIKSQHPQHLPTLLLSSCVHFSVGDHDACLRLCSEILDIDPNYVWPFSVVVTQLIPSLQVEAMSNIGMVFKARGAHREAENMLVDTACWTRNLEKGFQEIWNRWVATCASPW
jgi:hypothetical protein